MQSNNIKNINITKAWKITNKPSKIIFDNNYEGLIDLYGKFGDEKKYYDFFFICLKIDNYNDIIKYIFNEGENKENVNYFNIRYTY